MWIINACIGDVRELIERAAMRLGRAIFSGALQACVHGALQ
jgi:hypothetical protein